MASPAMRLAILAACADTFYVLIDGFHFEPRCVDEFSKRRATLALRQPALSRKLADKLRAWDSLREQGSCIRWLTNGKIWGAGADTLFVSAFHGHLNPELSADGPCGGWRRPADSKTSNWTRANL